MSPWTALLESLHSALIDEVTDRHPEPKPELGLPKRQSQFAFPSPEVSTVLWLEVSFATATGPSRGATMLALQPGFLKDLKLKTPQQLWEAMLKRAGSEFARRQIQPVFAGLSELTPSAASPKELAALPRVVWIPIKLPGGDCYFGVAA
jgi:hypothetical protein